MTTGRSFLNTLIFLHPCSPVGCLTAFLLLMPFGAVAQVSVQMEKRNGVFYVPCKVNGLELKFIFDTGASDVSISLTEAAFMMKNGFLVESDVVGSQRYQMANGAIEEGVVINLRQIEIGGRKVQNIKASVSGSLNAPLLLGTSVLESFGTVSVNYNTAVLSMGRVSKGEPSSPPAAELPPLSPSSGSGKVAEIGFWNPNLTYGSVTDIEGNTYATVRIGTQEWMAENLRTTRYRDGTVLPNVKDQVEWERLTTGAWCKYENNVGMLYNWYAVADKRGLCPQNWHVPTDVEWTRLTNYLGGERVAGDKMKTTTLWASPNTGATNASGFSGLPGGARFLDGDFLYLGAIGFWWSASDLGADIAWGNDMRYNDAGIFRTFHFKRFGFCVRCLRD